MFACLNNVCSQNCRSSSSDYGYLAHKKTDYLTKESESLTSSESMIDDQIFVAMRTREALRNQRSLMKTIQTQLTTLESKLCPFVFTFPMLC